MTENELMENIRETCKPLLLVFHPHDSRRCWGPGYPDLTIIGVRGAIWRECKDADGQLDGDQKRWKYRLKAAGLDWGLWRPADWYSQKIHAELEEIA